MVEKVLVQLEDDLDGSAAEETVRFSYRGNDYVIDLSAKNAAAFDRAMEKYVGAARPARGDGRRAARHSPVRSGRAARSSSREDLAAIREWAQANGYQVSSRGRIAGQIVEAYRAAH
jgi:hypothetical protein